MARRTGGKKIPFVPNTVKLLVFVSLVTGFILFRHGYIPARYSPFATVDLSDTSPWFIDWRIAQLANDRYTCERILKPPHVQASPVSNNVKENGCGWTNAYKISSAAGARFNIRMTCPMVAALTMWIQNIVQPAAQAHFGSKVTKISHYGGYSCRYIRGSIGRYVKIRSEHSYSNAIDVSAFGLANGTRIRVSGNWKGDSAKAKFIRDIHQGACSYFRVTLGPGANKLHSDHFHLDRGFLRSCR